jgi:hypothetical protein
MLLLRKKEMEGANMTGAMRLANNLHDLKNTVPNVMPPGKQRTHVPIQCRKQPKTPPAMIIPAG